MKLYQPALFSLVLFTSFAQAEVQKSQWVTTWAASPQKVWNKDFVFPTNIPDQISNQTIKQISHISLGGEAIRLVFTNQYGDQPLYIDKTTVGLVKGQSLKSKSAYPVYFSGKLKAQILPGKQLMSDPIQLPVPDHAQLMVNSFIEKPTTFKTFHWDAKQTSWLITGNQTANLNTPSSAKTTTARLLLSAVEVKPKRKAHVVAVIGDSITDGATATLDANTRWTDFLAKSLSPHQVAVINSGISGNRLLTNGMGDSALERLQKEVFQYSGVKTLIVLVGINDISWPGTAFAPKQQIPTFETLTQGYKRVVDEAHRQGIQVIGATLLPFSGALPNTPLDNYYQPNKDQLRQRINHWIRTSHTFDGVLDLEQGLKDPKHPDRLNPIYDSGDHLHPNDRGNQQMANLVDLNQLVKQ
ncbi:MULTISPECIES: SGNH/GDSL hydrolase family protein [Acinetobacter]|jgi:lysophospholipase L1-like esterase|uniref:SGNH/GDSL hydrolase family protein n=1 Tax=Acinetobacter pittii TaxID=48296 RepID=A0AAE9S7I9_ACIPI|nr:MULTISPECIES: SGNH/GDSL hydrolase family protein [Acinetobacter calcoaceticus/baumannii complex]AZP29751.1 SGNH/GDSL hydrolase family protein [Acinetobacter pittii]EXE27281.1 GDSL-like Lipase/Acylhydrolase family protein [Acinetobacter sp. 907131]EXS16787.1 GDSL-like Lipase/Acylhydrolase family protein [Acinetobacter sp. 883425]MBK0411176.1 SGNH/GDSL hydrolase family protein [Acinetobacter pittii]MBK1417243.1 SGNH/GDSL hydrolase family protein [Acinetobacter pittii]